MTMARQEEEKEDGNAKKLSNENRNVEALMTENDVKENENMFEENRAEDSNKRKHPDEGSEENSVAEAKKVKVAEAKKVKVEPRDVDSPKSPSVDSEEAKSKKNERIAAQREKNRKYIERQVPIMLAKRVKKCEVRLDAADETDDEIEIIEEHKVDAQSNLVPKSFKIEVMEMEEPGEIIYEGP